MPDPKPRDIDYYVDENGCHICTSHHTKKLNGKAIRIHKYVYLTEVRKDLKEIPKGKLVTRKCGNNKCINPDHLILTDRSGLNTLTAKKRKPPKPIDFDVDPVTGCFNCTSHPTNKRGYHYIKIDQTNIGVHCFVYEQMFGEIPEGLIVCHKCDNPHCINPEHLELGTHDDNMRQMVERGRSCKGSKHGQAKLTEEDVREIRRRLATGEGVNHLARVYGVHPMTISDIKLRKKWKHVD